MNSVIAVTPSGIHKVTIESGVETCLSRTLTTRRNGFLTLNTVPNSLGNLSSASDTHFGFLDSKKSLLKFIRNDSLQYVPSIQIALPEPAAACTASTNGCVAVVGGQSGSVWMWEPTTGNMISSFVGDARGIVALAFSSDDNYLIVAGTSGHIHCYSGPSCLSVGCNRASISPVSSFAHHSTPSAICLSEVDSLTHQFLVLSADVSGTISIFDPFNFSQGNLLTSIKLAKGHVRCIVASKLFPDIFYLGTSIGQILKLSLKTVLSAGNIRQKNIVQTLDMSQCLLVEMNLSCDSLCLSLDEATVISGDSECLNFWDVGSKRLLKKHNFQIDNNNKTSQSTQLSARPGAQDSVLASSQTAKPLIHIEFLPPPPAWLKSRKTDYSATQTTSLENITAVSGNEVQQIPFGQIRPFRRVASPINDFGDFVVFSTSNLNRLLSEITVSSFSSEINPEDVAATLQSIRQHLTDVRRVERIREDSELSNWNYQNRNSKRQKLESYQDVVASRDEWRGRLTKTLEDNYKLKFGIQKILVEDSNTRSRILSTIEEMLPANPPSSLNDSCSEFYRNISFCISKPSAV